MIQLKDEPKKQGLKATRLKNEFILRLIVICRQIGSNLKENSNIIAILIKIMTKEIHIKEDTNESNITSDNDKDELIIEGE